MITPHFGVKILDEQKNRKYTIRYNAQKNVISKDTSEVMKKILESVVSEGGEKKLL